MCPKTNAGKVVTIVYAVLGIPVMLACLWNAGTILAKSFKFVYSRFCCLLCRLRKRRLREIRRQAESHDAVIPQTDNQTHPNDASPSVVTSSAGNDISTDSDRAVSPPPPPPDDAGQITNGSVSVEPGPSECSTSVGQVPSTTPQQRESVAVDLGAFPGSTGPEVEEGEDVGKEEERVPMLTVFSIVIAYIFGGALVFSLWEDGRWSFLTGVYFCFVSLSTIGYGDLVPDNNRDDAPNGGQAKLIACCLYFLVGLCILVMAFHLVQQEVTTKLKNVAKTLGILEPESR